ncbi:MAG: hypothetical protein WAV21_02240 [Minisyncoccia bacterium]
MTVVKKIALLDVVQNGYEPYDRRFMLQMTYEFCLKNPSIIRNVSLVNLLRQVRLGGRVINAPHISFEIDEITEAKWEFLLDSIGSWAVKLEVLPDDTETTILVPSEFRK